MHYRCLQEVFKIVLTFLYEEYVVIFKLFCVRDPVYVLLWIPQMFLCECVTNGKIVLTLYCFIHLIIICITLCNSTSIIISVMHNIIVTVISRKLIGTLTAHPNVNHWIKIKYKVVQIWPGLIACKQVTVCPGHIWTTLYKKQAC
jgi:hypothetical protein